MNQKIEPMSLMIRYIHVDGGAAVLSCEGYGSKVCLPESVDGLLVKEILPYAFCSLGTADEHLSPGTEIFETATGNPPVTGCKAKFLGGSYLQEITLPSGISSIGEYAFYNCTALSKVNLCAGSVRIGNGAFMNCGFLNKISFCSLPNAKTCLSGLLGEIQRELLVEFLYGDNRSIWIFPEYFEESIENAPAHIFEHFIHGAGYRYRQSFQGERLDIEFYDNQFHMAKVEAEPETALRIALERVRHPYHLSKPSEKQYFGFLRENACEAAKLLIQDDNPEELSFLASHGILAQDSVRVAIETASKIGRAECLSILLNEQHSRFFTQEKSYDL